MKRTPIIFALLLTLALPAQNRYALDNYSGLRSEGAVPSDLRLTLDELYSLDKQRVRDYNDGKLTNRDKVLAASYNINKLMASGRILYGDPITRMAERIADTLLKDYPDLRKELRFYTVKSPEVNAFATGQGMIFVNAGLVAQAEDEAQLAYVISHEIVHYCRNHATEMLARKKSRNSKLDEGDRDLRDFIKRHNRSKEMENEADSLGLAMFYIGSPYDKRVTDGVFDVLQYGYLPFDEVAFDTNFFNTPYFKLPKEYFLEELSPITARDDYNDSLSTHPNLLKRRLKTSAQLEPCQGGSRFVTMTEAEFEELRTLARFECIRLELVYSEFARAFYDCYLLQRQYPDNQFLTRAMGQALYGISKNKTYTSTNNVVGDYSRMEGEVQQVYYCLRRIKADEMALVTAHYLYKASQRYPDDRQLAAMTEDIFADLGSKHGFKAESFAAEPPAAEAAADTAAAAKSNKYSRIKAKKRQQAGQDMRRYAFTDLFMQDSAFGSYLADALEGRSLRYAKSNGTGKNQMVYCPSYFVVGNNGTEVDYRRSYRNEEELVGKIAAIGSRFDMKTADFSDQSLNKMTEAWQYNEFVDLNEWTAEFMQSKGDFAMHYLMQPQMDRLIEKYNASLVNMSVVLNLEKSKFNPKGLILIWMWPIAPSLAYDMFANNEFTGMSTMLIDAQSGKVLSDEDNVHLLADHDALIKSNMYEAYTKRDTVKRAEDEKVKYPVPGYMGRRFALTAEGSLSLSFPSQWEEMGRVWMLSPSASAEFAMNEELSLTAGFNYKSSTSHVADPFHVGNCQFGIRRYAKKTNAPLGVYAGFGVTYSKIHYLNEVCPRGAFYHRTEKDKLSMFGMQLSFGRNYIFYDRLLLNLHVGYTISFADFEGLFDFDNDLDNPTCQTMVSNLIMVGLGVGFLPF